MTDEKKPFLSDEEIKTIVFAFCEYSNPMSSEKAFSHPPALTDRWKMWCETDKAKELINSAAEKANTKIAELENLTHRQHEVIKNLRKAFDNEKAKVEQLEKENQLIRKFNETQDLRWRTHVERLEKERDEFAMQLLRFISDVESGPLTYLSDEYWTGFAKKLLEQFKASRK